MGSRWQDGGDRSAAIHGAYSADRFAGKPSRASIARIDHKPPFSILNNVVFTDFFTFVLFWYRFDTERTELFLRIGSWVMDNR